MYSVIANRRPQKNKTSSFDMSRDGSRLQFRFLVTIALVLCFIAVNIFYSNHAHIKNEYYMQILRQQLEQLEWVKASGLQDSHKVDLNVLPSKTTEVNGGVDPRQQFAGNNFSIVPQSDTLQKIEKPTPKIAYVFAGSARSFVCPKVHWSIRSHLIDSLGGDPHVFVRVSEDDNKNVKTGTGVIWKQKYQSAELAETLKILDPKVVEHFSFADQIEEMKANYPGESHAVFREMDTRRYSMYFHRCMAYKLMTKYEVDHSMKFDWVILVRLDASWLEPSLPIESYANDRVWITETGYDLFNDQFMLVPRQFSDYLYDLNSKVHKDVYCLGGPDVEKWKCNDQQLKEHGITDEEKRKRVLDRCCIDRMKNTGDKQGFSERIHMKHLRHGQIPLALGRFPVFLTRRSSSGACHSECFRIFTYHYKEYVYRFGNALYPYLQEPIWPDTRGRSISARDKQACALLELYAGFGWQPITAQKLHHLKGYTPDYTKSLYSQKESLHPSLLVDPKDTEWWRIHPTFNVDGCLTMSYSDHSLSWKRCEDHSATHSLQYAPNQLFQLHVYPHRTGEFKGYYPGSEKTLRNEWYSRSVNINDGKSSTSVRSVSSAGNSTGYGTAFTRLVAPTAQAKTMVIGKGTMCLTVTGIVGKQALLKMEQCAVDVMEPTQLFLAVEGWSDGPRFLSTVGQLALAQHPRLCVTRSDNKETHNTQTGPNVASDDKLFLWDCDYRGSMHRARFEFELIR